MIRLAICDDMKEFLVSTKNVLEQWENKPNDMVIECFQDGTTLIESHRTDPFDIILLDVVMPVLNGIDTAAEIRKHDMSVKIVFLTTSSEFAVDAFSVHASNYILKPIVNEKLYECLLPLLIDVLSNSRCINVKCAHTVHRVELRNIEYVEAQGKKVLFALSDGRRIESVNPFYSFEKQLLSEDSFIKCHRSYMVNVFKIATYSQTEVIMESGARIPISRSARAEFETAYFELLFDK